ncbi:cell wall-binding repeat-containing protein [Leifsonia sp. NPDC102414]|uniref:cell wall-binding repeat-containing protein n=1 Tax=Leifsonia sp. NPDC102414 TaxID=3364124 RepID=UPI0038272F2F
MTTIAVTLGGAILGAPAQATEAAVAAPAVSAEASASASRAASVESVLGPVKTAVGSDFKPGYIISDYNFYNGSALDAGRIQSFLNSQVSSCRAGYTCLKDYRQNTYSRAGDALCAAYTGGANETAATIIAKVGAACGISQKVILVLLQKEQSLVTDDWPTTGQYNKATGYACPDTSACDTQYYGFYNQVYMAAWQFKRYGNPPGTSNSFTWFPVGQVSAIRWSPVASCGAGNVLIQNAATAALYYYTPYQPNAAALANMYGTGDSCSAYGNRNFWRLYTDWFGPTTGGAAPIGNYESATVGGSTFAIAGWAIDQTMMRAVVNVQITWNTPSGVTTQTVAANGNRPDVGNAYPFAGANHGFTASIPRSGDGQYSACVTAIATTGNTAGNSAFGCRTVLFSSGINGSPSSSRVQGADRFDTSVAVSKAAYPAAGVPVVYIASGANFADAISAGPAAAAQKGPLLLANVGFVPASVLAEIKRLSPAKIVVVGGAAAIGDSVVATLKTVQPNTVRVAGYDRFETSRQLARYAFPAATGAYFASGVNFPDALSAAAAAAVAAQPMLLVTGSAAVDAPTAAYLAGSKVKTATVIGGPSAVGTGFESSLQSRGVAATRIGGSDRFDTSHLINAAKFPTASTVYIAAGTTFPDALSGSTLAGATRSPLFVTPGWCVPRAIGNDIAKMKATRVVFIGGPSVLSGDATAFKPC